MVLYSRLEPVIDRASTGSWVGASLQTLFREIQGGRNGDDVGEGAAGEKQANAGKWKARDTRGVGQEAGRGQVEAGEGIWHQSRLCFIYQTWFRSTVLETDTKGPVASKWLDIVCNAQCSVESEEDEWRKGFFWWNHLWWSPGVSAVLTVWLSDQAMIRWEMKAAEWAKLQQFDNQKKGGNWLFWRDSDFRNRYLRQKSYSYFLGKRNISTLNIEMNLRHQKMK